MVNRRFLGYHIEMKKYFIQEERRGNYCSKLKKKVELNTKKMSKITILDEQKSSVKHEQTSAWENFNIWT